MLGGCSGGVGGLGGRRDGSESSPTCHGVCFVSFRFEMELRLEDESCRVLDLLEVMAGVDRKRGDVSVFGSE